MNGDSRETGKRTPAGDPEPSVFSTEFNREGIKLGSAVGRSLGVVPSRALAEVCYRDFWGVGKRDALVASLDDPAFDSHYQLATPTAANRFNLRPQVVARGLCGMAESARAGRGATVQWAEREAQGRLDQHGSRALGGAHAPLP